MVEQGLAPGVQHGGDPNLRVQIIAPEFQQGGRHRVEQQGVQPGAILLDQRIKFMRQREHQMEVGNGQERFGLLVQPVKPIGPLAGGAMAVTAGVRHEMFFAAMAATIMMSAQGGRAAGHEGAQDFPMVVGQTVFPCVPGNSRPQHFRQGQSRSRRLDRRKRHASGDQA